MRLWETLTAHEQETEVAKWSEWKREDLIGEIFNYSEMAQADLSIMRGLIERIAP